MSEQYGGDTATIATPVDESSNTQRYEEARAAANRAMTSIAIPHDPPTVPSSAGSAFAGTEVDAELLSYRGFKFGAAFFGWLIAIAMSVLLLAAVTAAALGTAEILDYTTGDAKAEPAAAAITGASVAVLMLCLAFYTGGYVAGRLARFDGGRQGFGVWMFAVVLSALAVGTLFVVDNQYDLLDDLNKPDVALSSGTPATGTVVAAAARLVHTLLAAILGGKSGKRYHDKIDRLLD
jgi:hypothetical protein